MSRLSFAHPANYALFPAVLTFLSALLVLPVYAAPTGEAVIQGAATFNRSAPGTLTIHQGSHRAIIHWNDFSIAAGELTRFVQPSASSAVLNRVVGLNPSEIYGTLQANGQVYLINRNGILVGPGGRINTLGFVASTLDIPDAGFLSGSGLTFSGNSTAKVDNQGVIESLGGDVYLIAHQVENSGAIRAPEGTVGLAAGSEVLLQPTGSERVSVLAGNTTAATAGTGVDNAGLVEAASAELKSAGGNVYGLAINNGGSIRATHIVNENGRIMLRASGGRIVNTGTLDASAQNGDGGSVIVDAGHNADASASVTQSGSILVAGGAEGRGGSARVTGDRILVTGDAVVDASGPGGGGEILIGGGRQGANPDVRNATSTDVQAGAVLNADALDSGHGGDIIVWSEGATRFGGTATARGGARGGDGGFVETSGRQSLVVDASASVRAGAPQGARGLWLLDPTDVTIDAAMATTINASLNGDTDVTVTTSAAGPDTGIITIDAAILKSMGTGAALILSADASIVGNVGGTITSSGGGPLDVTMTAGTSITLNDAITSSGGDVSLSANNGITLNDNIATGGGVLSLNADADNNASGLLDIGAAAALTTADGAANLTSANITLAGTLNSGDGLVTLTASGNQAVGIGAGAVSYQLSGAELANITSAGGARVVATGAGTVTVDSVSAANSDNITGLFTIDSAAAITFAGGASTFNSLSAESDGGITLNFGVTTDSGPLSLLADANDDNSGDLTLGAGATANSMGQAMNLSGNNIAINATGALDSGDGTITLTASTGRKVFIGEGGTGTDFVLSDPELVRIFTTVNGGLTVVARDADLEVEGVFPEDRPNLHGVLTVEATGNTVTSGNIGLVTKNSSFEEFVARADRNISLDAFITSDRDLTLIADADNDGVGTFSTVSGGGGPASVDDARSIGGNLVVAGADLILNDNLTSDSGSVTLIASGGRSIGLGTAAGDFAISGAELSAISGASLRLVTSGTGAIAVDAVTSPQSDQAGPVTLAAGGAVTFGVTASTFAGVTVESATSVTLGGNLTTTTDQSYDAPVILTGNRTLAGVNIAFNDTLDSSAGNLFTLAVNASGVSRFAGTVGGTDRLASLTTSAGGRTELGATLNTSGASITFNDAVLLVADTVINEAGVGNVTFASTVDSEEGNNFSLTVNTPGGGNTIFGGAVGSDALGAQSDNAGLGALTTDATGITRINGTSVTTVNAQTYNDAVTLGANVTLNGGSVAFGNTLNSSAGANRTLAINASGVTRFGGIVGGVDQLASLTTDAAGSTEINGGAVSSTGTQTYNDAVALGANTTLAGGSVIFANTLNSSAGNLFTLAVNASGTTRFGGIVGGTDRLASLTTDAGGRTELGANLNTSGASITFNDAVLLVANTVINEAGVGNVTFNSTVDSADGNNFTLTVNTLGGGSTIFNGAVGSDALAGLSDNAGLGALTTDAAGGVQINGASVTTVNAQTYNDAAVLGANTTLNGGSVVFASTLNSSAGNTFTLAVNASGATRFGGAVGGVDQLASLTTDGPGSTEINGGAVSTTQTQTYNDDVTLGANTILNGGSVVFNDTLNSSAGTTRTLAVNSAGVTRFGGVVGAIDRLASLTTDAGGRTELGANLNVNGGGVTFNDAVLLTGNSVIAGAGAGSVAFNSTVDSANGNNFNLTVNTVGGGSTTFAGAVGADALAALSDNAGLGALTTDASGATRINGGSVTTVNAQTYNDAVILGANTTVNGGSALFNSTVNSSAGNNFTLAVNASATTRFGGAVGGVDQLASLTTDGPGTTEINGGAVSTTGTQTYGDDVLLGANTTLNGASVLFNDTLNSSAGTTRTLQVNAAGTTRFGGVVGGVDALASLATDAAGATEIAASGVTTTGTQTYNDVVTLSANTTLAGGSVLFNSTLDSAAGVTRTLTVNASGITRFVGAVGAVDQLASLTTDAAGTTEINGGSVASTGTQTYNDDVLLGANTTLSGGSVLFNDTLNSSAGTTRTLQVNATGTTRFAGVVGGTDRLATLTTDAGGRTEIGANVNLNGAGSAFNDAVLLTGNSVISEIGAGNIVFNSTVDSASGNNFNLTVNTTGGGDTLFNGAIGTDALGGASADTGLGALVTDAAGLTRINGGTVTTVNAQTYNDAVLLGADTTVNAGSALFNSTVNSAAATTRSLTVNAAGITRFVGAVGAVDALAALTTDGPGSTEINGGGVVTTGTQTYGDDVRLGANSVFNGGSVLFNDTLNSSAGTTRTLLVNAAGTTRFAGTVGGLDALASITTDAPGTTEINAAAVTSTGAQTYNDAVRAGANTVLNAASVLFNSLLNSAAGQTRGVTVNASGVTRFTGAVGLADALAFLTTDAAGSTEINGGAVATTGAQTYNDSVTLGANTTLTGGSVAFGGALNSAPLTTRTLVVNASGITRFAGAVGAVDQLADLTTDAAGVTEINGGSVSTTGAQTYNDDALLGANTVLNGSSVVFNDTLNSSAGATRTLQVNAAGLTRFAGAVGAADALASVVTDAPGSTEINGGSVRTTGGQTYNDDVLLGANTTLTSLGGGNVLFNDTLNSAPATTRSLTVNAGGITRFAGAVGTVDQLVSLTTDAAGTTEINGGAVTTTGAQNYQDDVTLDAAANATTLTAGTVTFGQTLRSVTDGEDGLAVIAATTTFNGAVGDNSQRLASLTDDGVGTTAINGGGVFTDGAQTYADVVTLGADTTLRASQVSFQSTVTGGGNVDLAVVADQINIQAAVNSGTVSLAPRTSGRSVRLFGVDDAFNLALSPAELGLITASILQVGNASAGPIALQGALTLLPAQVPRLLLINGGSISGNGTLNVQQLGIQSAGPVLLNGANDVDVLAAILTGVGSRLFFSDVDQLRIDSLGLIGGGNLNGVRAIPAPGTNPQLTEPDPNPVPDPLIRLRMNRLDLAAPILANAGGTRGRVVLEPFTAGTPISLGNEIGSHLSLTQAELDLVTAGVLQIGNAVAGQIDINQALVFDPARVPILSLWNDAPVQETAAAGLDVQSLAIRSFGNVDMNGNANLVDRLAALVDTKFTFTSSGLQAPPTDFNAAVDGLFGVDASQFDNQTAALAEIAQLTYVEVPMLRPRIIKIDTNEDVEPPSGLEPNDVWTYYLLIQYPKEKERRRVFGRIEDVSNWTSGRYAVSGTTTGPQAPR